uniref:Retrovirus-related Pol polyprotein from transposon TNT 1-94-like beta-barrel domain-containing protein n=1 Tax=Tanacetum cinerariifolium TaxID=118510 RepID=A0A6L2KXF8_TANCI|nr:hypothetical protein [Tanacetum cinerariifolium]
MFVSLKHVLIALIEVEGCDDHWRSSLRLAIGQLVNGSSFDGIDMVIKDLDLELKDIVAEFCSSSQWKELSKETSSKILPCGDGSCWKTDENVDDEEADAFNLLTRNFRKGNRFGRVNRFGNSANKFGRGRINSFGNKGGESSKPKGDCYNYVIEGHFASECRKLKENDAFIRGAWSDSEEGDEHQNDATCLMAIDLQEVCLKCDLLPDDWIMNSGCTKHMTKNRRLFTLYKAHDGGHVIFGSNLKGKVVGGGRLCDDDCVVSFTKVDCIIDKNGHANMRLVQNLSSNELVRNLPKLSFERHFYDTCGLGSQGYSQTSKAYIVLTEETMRIKESVNVTIDESLPEPKSYPSIEDDGINKPIVQDLNGLPSLQVNVSDEGYPKSLKEARGHPLKQVIGELNERKVRGATLQKSVEHQEHKTTRTGRAQEGMCMLKLLTPQLWCLVMDLEVMIGVTKLKKDLTMHLWHNPLQVLILRKKLETVQMEKDGIQLTVEKLENASKSLNKLIDSQIVDNCKKGLGYNAVPPPHTGLFMPLKPDLSYIGLEEFTSEPAVETLNAKISEEVPKLVTKDNGAPIIKD